MHEKNLVASALAVAMAVTVGYAQAQREASPSAPADARMFINEMAIAGMTEVELGKMAVERAQSTDVKESERRIRPGQPARIRVG